jgi:hypothetical protein
MLMQHSGMSAKGEPRNVVNGLIPRPLLKEYTQEDCVHRVLQGAVPDVAYTDPGHGREMIVELKFINPATEIPPTHGGAEKDGTGVPGLGPPARQGTTHGRTFRRHHRVAVVVEPDLTCRALGRARPSSGLNLSLMIGSRF